MAKIVNSTITEKNLFWDIFSSRELIENGYPNGLEIEFVPLLSILRVPPFLMTVSADFLGRATPNS
jgi:hypothetical protein